MYGVCIKYELFMYMFAFNILFIFGLCITIITFTLQSLMTVSAFVPAIYVNLYHKSLDNHFTVDRMCST